jgi:hypothetical protein
VLFYISLVEVLLELSTKSLKNFNRGGAAPVVASTNPKTEILMQSDSDILVVQPEKPQVSPGFVLGEWGEIHVKTPDGQLIKTGSVFMQVS